MINDDESMSDIEVLPSPRPGPESKYESWMCDKIVQIANEGGHVAQMIVAIGVKSRDTFYRWVKDHQEFSEAYEYSKIVSKALHEQLLVQGALGKIPNFNATAFAMIMNNKFGDEYKRTGSGGSTEITINNLNLPPEQLTQRIAQKMEALKQLGVDLNQVGEYE